MSSAGQKARAESMLLLDRSVILPFPLPAVGLGTCEDAVGSMEVVEPPLCVTGTLPHSLRGPVVGTMDSLYFKTLRYCNYLLHSTAYSFLTTALPGKSRKGSSLHICVRYLLLCNESPQNVVP